MAKILEGKLFRFKGTIDSKVFNLLIEAETLSQAEAVLFEYAGNGAEVKTVSVEEINL